MAGQKRKRCASIKHTSSGKSSEFHTEICQKAKDPVYYRRANDSKISKISIHVYAIVFKTSSDEQMVAS